MHPRVLETLRTFLGSPDCEGRHRSMYRDTGGNSVGIGCQMETVEEALRLPWTLRNGEAWGEGGREGTIRREYARIRGGGNGSQGPEAIVLNDRAIDNLFEQQAHENERILRQVFQGWDQFPADAQLGMLHHSWIRPSRAGIESWHEGRYAAAVNARRWNEAGHESLWDQLRERRHRRRESVLRMFRNAAVVEEARPSLPVSMLFFPRDAAPSAELRQRRQSEEVGSLSRAAR